MSKYSRRAFLGMAVVAGAEAAIEASGVGFVTRYLSRITEYSEIPRNENFSMKFVLGPHGNESDADAVIDEVCGNKGRKCTHLFIEGPSSFRWAADQNLLLQRMAIEYNRERWIKLMPTLLHVYEDRLLIDIFDDEESFLFYPKGKFKKGLMMLFHNESYGGFLSELILEGATAGVVPQFFETYSLSDAKELMNLSAEEKIAKIIFSSNKHEDYIEPVVDVLAKGIRFRHPRMIERLSDIEREYGKHRFQVGVFMGCAHRDVAEHFVKGSNGLYEMVELPSKQPTYISAVMRKARDPSYRMSEEEKRVALKEILG